MDQETRIETRMIWGSERCFEAESGMRREGVKGWVSSGPRDPTHQRHPVPCSW